MTRRTILALPLMVALPSPVAAETKKPVVESGFLTTDTIDWFNSLLVVKTNAIDDSDFPEILARLGYVLLGLKLPAEAKLRTLARANSLRPDRIPILRIDMTSAMRAICVIISRLDDRIAPSSEIQKL